MAHHVETDIAVSRFAFDSDDKNGLRLTFPHSELGRIEGRSGSVRYGMAQGVFEKLVGRLDRIRWTANTVSLGGAWLKDDEGRVDVQIERLEINNDLILTRGASGMEVIAPQATLHEMRVILRGPFGSPDTEVAAPAPPPAPVLPPQPPPSIRESKSDVLASGVSFKPPPLPEDTLKQERFRFLDSLGGKIAGTVNVVLDLPVLGKRSLDQKLSIPVEGGSLDYRALEKSLDWLEGRFLDLEHNKDKFSIRWKVPIFGGGRDLVAWELDDDAQKQAAFGRVPVRSLLDFKAKAETKKKDDKKQILKSLSLDDLNMQLSLIAPRSLEVGGGMIMFGGEDAPGMVGFKVTGSIRQQGPGKLAGVIGSVDTTIKDLHVGGVSISADRLHLAEVDHFVVTFDGFTPVAVELVVHRVTATNLALHLGEEA